MIIGIMYVRRQKPLWFHLLVDNSVKFHLPSYRFCEYLGGVNSLEESYTHAV